MKNHSDSDLQRELALQEWCVLNKKGSHQVLLPALEASVLTPKDGLL